MSPVAPGDFVKVQYHGRDKLVTHPDGSKEVVHDDTSPLDLMWNSRRYPIPVGSEGFVPFEAAANAFGDPRAAEMMGSYKDEAGNVGFILDRATEVRRLRTLYDNQTGPENQILYAPQVTVADLEGNPISTVLDDPEGVAVHPVAQTALDRDSLLAQLQRQQRMIEMLAAQQGIDLNNANLAVQEPDVNPDANPDEAIVPEPGGPTPEPLPEDK